jgi:hypothetical protein
VIADRIGGRPLHLWSHLDAYKFSDVHQKMTTRTAIPLDVTSSAESYRVRTLWIFFPVVTGPLCQTGDRLKQAAPELRQFVFNAWRNCRIRSSLNQTVSLQAFQCERQHALGDTLDPMP